MTTKPLAHQCVGCSRCYSFSGSLGRHYDQVLFRGVDESHNAADMDKIKEIRGAITRRSKTTDQNRKVLDITPHDSLTKIMQLLWDKRQGIYKRFKQKHKEHLNKIANDRYLKHQAATLALQEIQEAVDR